MITYSSDFKRVKIKDVHLMLTHSYWTPGITENEIQKGIQNSALVMGAFSDDDRQVGFLRVVSDKVRFAYILDVIVAEDFRHQGIGQNLVKMAMADPELKDVYKWLLTTMDAHKVYEKCGLELLQDTERWMAIMNPRPERKVFD